MEWQPDSQEPAPFWPGNVERRGPRWGPIFIALGVVILVVLGLILWLGRDSEDDTASPPEDANHPAGPGSER